MLTVHCLQVIAETTTPLVLDEHCGSAIRGAFFHALWGRFCVNHEAATCNVCPLIDACPVASLVAPLREKCVHGPDIPRPYLIFPPDRGGQKDQEDQKDERTERIYEPGARLAFELRLIGTSAKLFPYVIRALQEMEQFGMGRPIPSLKGRRGRFLIREVRAYHPYSGEEQLLWQRGSTLPQRPSLSITHEDIVNRALQLEPDQIRIHFTSPTRLVQAKQFLQSPNFHVLMLRLADRFEQLLQWYGQHDSTTSSPIGGREWYLQIGKWAQEVQLVTDETQWVDVLSYSARQKQSMAVSGFLGRATFAGNIVPLRELLSWGEIIGVGKSITKGAGHYLVETIDVQREGDAPIGYSVRMALSTESLTAERV